MRVIQEYEQITTFSTIELHLWALKGSNQWILFDTFRATSIHDQDLMCIDLLCLVHYLSHLWLESHLYHNFDRLYHMSCILVHMHSNLYSIEFTENEKC